MATTDQSNAIPNSELTQEVRFAVVIYGGVSLAIYINGIAQEMLRLVRATAFDGKSLKGSEKVYRILSQILGHPTLTPLQAYRQRKDDDPVRTRFVIDVLSGTSAGGINAIFLAKALANNQKLDRLEKLWVEEGDIEKLLNDRKSLTPRLAAEKPPESLLNSNRMYLKLLDALDEMDAVGRPEDRTPLVEELDLFSTATDIVGLTVPIALNDGMVQERRHRNVFHFQHPSPEAPHDFKADDNPFLAYAARCTSAFPFAFQPMALCDIFPIVQTASPHRGENYCDPSTDHWRRFYLDYIGSNNPDRFDVPFARRAFGDGGYLDNKPFGYAIDTIFKRHAGLPVIRKLAYVEPSPEQLRHPDKQDRPDAVENSLAALVSLPRYETIREDLERVLSRNLQVQRVKRALNDIERDLDVPRSGGDPGAWIDPEQQYGAAYRAYERLKVSAVVEDLVRLVAKAFEIDLKSAYGGAIRTLADAWVESRYPTEAGRRRFLLDFDIQYRLRRIRRLREVIYDLRLQPPAGTPGEQTEYREELQRIKAALKKPHDAFHEVLDQPRHSSDFPGVVEAIPQAELGLITEPRDLHRWKDIAQYPHAAEFSERGRAARARYVLEKCGRLDLLNSIAQSLQTKFEAEFRACSTDVAASFADAPKLRPSAAAARAAIRKVYNEFEAYDSIMFPISFGNDLGEQQTIEVYRISPDDAQARREDVPISGDKVKGQAMGAFASFLDKTWRENDILWGRLDGAERLIQMLLPASDCELAAVRSELIDMAHREITMEVVPGANDSNWKQCLKGYVGRVRPELEPALVARSASRATAITGALLENIAEKRGVTRKPFHSLALIGRFLWEFVEVSVPRSSGELFFVYWLQLLLLFALTLTVVGAFASSRGLLQVGLGSFAVLSVLYVARRLLRAYLSGKAVFSIAAATATSAAVSLAIAIVAQNLRTLSPRGYGWILWAWGAVSAWWSHSAAPGASAIADFPKYLAWSACGMTAITGLWAFQKAGRKDAGPLPDHLERKRLAAAINATYPLTASYTIFFLSLGVYSALHGQWPGWLAALLGLTAGITDFATRRATLAALDRLGPTDTVAALPKPPRPAIWLKWATLPAASLLALVLFALAQLRGA